jgi:hypothetical protein
MSKNTPVTHISDHSICIERYIRRIQTDTKRMTQAWPGDKEMNEVTAMFIT